MVTTCLNCGRSSPLISSALSLCPRCIKDDWASVRSHVDSVHPAGRSRFVLPGKPPKDASGLECRFCVNECIIPEGASGYCGLRKHSQGRILGGAARANVSWYDDPLPTNCVGDWTCAGGTGRGYPKYSHVKGPEVGYNNLAVFFRACSFNCLFCQNWHYRYHSTAAATVEIDDLVNAVDDKTSCICYFGGDPSPHLPYSIAAAVRARARNPGRILRICWETNGSMNPNMLRKMAALSMQSGGCIKFDLKAWDERLHIALCGVTNRRTLENFALLAQLTRLRREPPPLIASTLLIPGYIDEEEVAAIAAFIARLNPEIPYSLLAFHPQFMMQDLPPTSRSQAKKCLEAARSAGVINIHVGNIHLLEEPDY